MDNLLFTTGIKYTFEEYKTFNEMFLKQRNRNYIRYIPLGLAGLACFVAIVGILTEGNVWELFCTIFPLLLLAFGFRPIMNKGLKRLWRESDEADDVWYYGFYEDYMEQTTRKGVNKIYYNQMYEIIETETHFYPMIGKNNGFIIRKENCRPELIGFLHEKARELDREKMEYK